MRGIYEEDADKEGTSGIISYKYRGRIPPIILNPSPLPKRTYSKTDGGSDVTSRTT